MSQLFAGILRSSTCVRCGATNGRCHCGGHEARPLPDGAEISIKSVVGRASG